MRGSSCGITCTERARYGQGAVVILVVCFLVLLAMMGAASYFMGSGTGRTFGRTVDARLALEAADAAIFEAVSLVRVSMDTGTARPPACPDNWRSLLFGALAAPSTRPSGRKVIPLKAREVFREQAPGMAIGDVTVDVAGLYVDRPAAGQRMKFFPQGTLDMSVTVEGSRRVLTVKRTVRQRRVFWVSVPFSAYSTGTLDCPASRFTLLTNPLGTVVE